MTWYEYGATVTLTQAGDSGDDAQLFVTAPDGTESTPSVTFSAGTGLWSGSVTANQYDRWEFAWRLDGEIVETGSFDVGGPWYSTLAAVKKRLNRGSTDTSPDDIVAANLLAASRDVEQFCDSRPVGAFLLADSTSIRTYRPSTRGPALPGVVWCTEHGYRLYVHEIGATGYTVETSDTGTTWTTLTEGTDYDAYPDNALDLGQPIAALVSDTAWPARVRVTAQWGWPSVPSSVTEATILRAAYLYTRKDSPQGVLGSDQWGLIRVPHLDPDFKRLLGWLHTDALIA